MTNESEQLMNEWTNNMIVNMNGQQYQNINGIMNNVMDEIIIESVNQQQYDDMRSRLNIMNGEYEDLKGTVRRQEDEIKKLNKNNNTITVVFKALPEERLLEELEKQGYRVRFETTYDSSKQEKYLTRLRVTNPKFDSKGTNFMDTLEDQIRECAFAQPSFQVSDDAKKIFQTFMSNLK